MALYDIPLETTPVDLAVSYTYGMVMALRSTGVDMIKWYPGKPRNAKQPEITRNVTSFRTQDSVRQITFLSATRIAVLLDSENCCILKHYDVDFEFSTVTHAGEDILPLETTKIVSDALGAPDELYYVEDHRKVASINDPSVGIEFPSPCPWVEVAKFDDQLNYFGLGENGRLYANNTLIASNCTSFIVTMAHLIYTTTQHLLKFVHLQTIGNGEIHKSKFPESILILSYQALKFLRMIQPVTSAAGALNEARSLCMLCHPPSP